MAQLDAQARASVLESMDDPDIVYTADQRNELLRCMEGGDYHGALGVILKAIEMTKVEKVAGILGRLSVMHGRFKIMGAQNEEVSEYVLSILDYIIGYSQDDPTSDWIIKQTS